MCALLLLRLCRLWTRQYNCRVLLKRAGATPRTFWAAESRKSGVLPPISVVSIPLLFGFRSEHRLLFEGSAEGQGEELGTDRGAE